MDKNEIKWGKRMKAREWKYARQENENKLGKGMKIS